MSAGDCERLAILVATGTPGLPYEAYMTELRSLTGIEDCIRDGLRKAFDQSDWDEFYGYLMAASEHPSSSQTQVLCEALALRTTSTQPEDIVEVLGDIRDPSAVPYLIDALQWEPDWDEFHHLGRKCIWALAAIASTEANQALLDAASCGPLEVREAASFALERRKR